MSELDFEWMQRRPTRQSKDTTIATHDDEIRRRAQGLARLGYAQKDATKRIQQNIKWEFERVGKPVALQHVKTLVAEIYAREGRGKQAKKTR